MATILKIKNCTIEKINSNIHNLELIIQAYEQSYENLTERGKNILYGYMEAYKIIINNEKNNTNE
jgi:hypothetical protein